MINSGLVFAFVIVAMIMKATVHRVYQWERLVIFTFGRFTDIRNSGLRLVIPWIQTVRKIDIRTITLDVPSQDIITKDNISVKVNAVLFYRVIDAAKAINEVNDFEYSTNQIAQTTLRAVCGQVELDELLTKRDEINHKIQAIIDAQTDPWGIKVSLVEIKHIDLPQEMQRAMAKQAEAERERRAKVIQAEGEFQAAEKLTEAAKIMAGEETTMQLRYLETLRHIATEHNSTIIFPLPIDFMKGFIDKK